MKKIRLGILCSFGLCFIGFAKGQTLDYSGYWKINSIKTNFGGLDPKIAAPKLIVVDMGADSILVTREFEGSQISKIILNFNKKKVERISKDGNTLSLHSVERTDSGLVFKSHYEVGGNEWHYERTETWNLSSDGKILSIHRVTVLPDKIDRVKAFYNR